MKISVEDRFSRVPGLGTGFLLSGLAAATIAARNVTVLPPDLAPAYDEFMAG